MENCVICNNNLKKINSFVLKCNNCLFLKSDLKPGYGREFEGLSELRINNFKQILKITKKINNSNKLRILEIGSGKGIFIEECKKFNIDITGSVPDEEELEILRKRFDNTLKISLPLKDNEENNYSQFDYIVFNDVFEHLENLDKVIIQLQFFLKDNGKILINLPSSDGLIFKFSNTLNYFGFTNFYNRLWQKGLPSPHLSYFNNSNLKLLFKKHGYDLIYSSSLNTVSKNGNFKRINSTIKNKLICALITFFVLLFYYIQKLLPRDLIFHIYEKIKK